jgi:predicted Zn-dependent peptidase
MKNSVNIHYDTFELANGLRVIVQPDPSVQKAAVNVLYRVGAADETPARTGLAHLFEHLMFGGSKNIPHYDAHVQRVGGENNAFTNSDITNYYITLPAAQLETAFWLESDRMLELDFSQRSLDVQKSVVMEEFKQRYLNQPYGDAYLLLRPLVYQHHPYQWMTIGKELSHIETVELGEIKDFFFSFYAPNNATLVVAGGVTTQEVERLANKWFGPIPRRDVRRPARATEPPQQEARTLTVHKPVPFAGVYKAYRAPARNQPGYRAADLLTDLLSGGKASRLYRHLVKETQVAATVSAFSWGLYDDGLISINAQIAQGRSVEEYERELAVVLRGLDSLSDAELQRQKNKVESSGAFEKTEVANRALALAVYDSFADAALINTDVSLYQAVTLAQVQEARAALLQPHNCSTLYYLPQN